MLPFRTTIKILDEKRWKKLKKDAHKRNRTVGEHILFIGDCFADIDERIKRGEPAMAEAIETLGIDKEKFMKHFGIDDEEKMNYPKNLPSMQHLLKKG